MGWGESEREEFKMTQQLPYWSTGGNVSNSMASTNFFEGDKARFFFSFFKYQTEKF